MSIYYLPFVFKDTATSEIYTLSLHDALPILAMAFLAPLFFIALATFAIPILIHLTQRERKQIIEFPSLMFLRSEEHTSELQSQSNLVCRLLLEKKKEMISTSALNKIKMKKT